MNDYKQLKVWQEARELCKVIYELSGAFPDSERYGLSNQARRAATSVMLNIAEGAGRNSTKEFKQFLSIANGSLNEVEVCFIIALDQSFISKNDFDRVQARGKVIGKMLYRLSESLSQGVAEPITDYSILNT